MKMQLQFYTTPTELNTTNSALRIKYSSLKISCYNLARHFIFLTSQAKETKMSRACGHEFCQKIFFCFFFSKIFGTSTYTLLQLSKMVHTIHCDVKLKTHRLVICKGKEYNPA